MSKLSSWFSFYRVKYEDGIEVVFMVDRRHFSNLFGEGAVEILEVDEAEFRRR